MYSIKIIFLIGCIFSVASMVHGVCGFGFGLLSVGLLTIIIGPTIAVPIVGVASLANCLYLGWLLRREIMYREILLLTLLSLVFIPVGTLFLAGCDSRMVSMTLGIVIIFIVLLSLINRKYLRLFALPWFKWFAAISSGILSGAFNIPGPPFILYAYNCGWSVKKAIANLQFIFSVMAVVTIISLMLAGLLKVQTIVLGILYMPLIMVFTFAGARVSNRLSPGGIGVAINFVFILVGIILITHR